jgi:4-oxalocrotonate tautomerase
MPFVRIDIMEGRPPEMIRELHGRVAALVAEILDTPIERVRTYITQFPPEAWGIGGVPADVARADEVAARRAAAQKRDGAGADRGDGANAEPGAGANAEPGGALAGGS